MGRQNSVYMDNFFSSIQLYLRLLEDDIYATGTLRSDRQMFPADLVGAARRGLPSRGDSEFGQDGNLVVTVWQDTRPVVMLSTQHSPDCTTTVRRKKGDGSTISVTCPQAVVDYNQYMGGVDLEDQYRKYYQVRILHGK